MEYNTCDKQRFTPAEQAAVRKHESIHATYERINQMENRMNNQIAAPQVEVPTLAARTLAIDLNISVWTARKKDKRASAKVNSDNYAISDAATVNKNLLAGCDLLTEIKTMAGNIRSLHYSYTLPWTDSGTRIIMTAGYPEYIAEMTALITEFNRLVALFIDQYDFEIISVRARLGDMFDETEYPPSWQVRNKFDVKLVCSPVADMHDWRLDVDQDAQTCFDEAIAGYGNAMEQRINGAMTDIHERLRKVLSNMSERLDFAGKEDKKTFRNTLLDNVLDIVDLMRKCNLTDDTQLTAQADTLERALRGVSPEALRDSSQLRAETKRTVDQVIASLPSIDL